jgi:alkyl hydroperoxide reductase subunit D
MFEKLLDQLPAVYQDVKTNTISTISKEGSPELTEKQMCGIALAAAYATSNKKLFTACEAEFKNILSMEEIKAAKIAATMMAMNNVYYRFVELAHDTELNDMLVGLCVSFMNNPGIARLDFGLYSLGVSAINGCGHCIKAHMTQVIQSGLSKHGAQSAVKIAATINSLAQALKIEEATTIK